MSIDAAGDFLYLMPLTVAAGLDLYLAILLLGASALGGWSEIVPARLADLGTPAVVALAALFYAFETGTSRVRWASTAWNVSNTFVRAVGCGGLALLAVGAPTPVGALAVVAAAGVGGGIHLARTGWWLELDLRGVPARARLITLAAEDVVVAALLPVILDRPTTRLLLAAFVVAVGAIGVRRHLSAGLFAHGLIVRWVRGMLARGRWADATALPSWAYPPSGVSGPEDQAVRCAPAAAWGESVPGGFRRGWLVVALSGPLFAYRRRRVGLALGLSEATGARVQAQPLHSRVDLTLPDADRRGQGSALGLAIPRGGPGVDALQQLFGRNVNGAGTR